MKKYYALLIVMLLIFNAGSTAAQISKDSIIKSFDCSMSLNSDKVMQNFSEELDRKIVLESDAMMMNSKPHTDMEYILEALNLLEPYANKISGVTKNFRFFDGNKKKIVANQGLWIFNMDNDVGSPKFMQMLFPSSSGNLSVDGGSRRTSCFSADCNPTPEMIAKVAKYFHDYVRNADDCVKHCMELKMILGRNINIKKNFLNKKLDVTDDDFGRALDDQAMRTAVNTLLKVLLNGTIMILNQEENDEDSCNVERTLPRYTTEKMLMGYFIEKFNTQDEVKRFYDYAQTITKTYDVKNYEEKVKKLENLKKVIERLDKQEFTPYESATVSNGYTLGVSEADESGKVRFVKQTFQDCAEIAVRHVMNLLLYSREKNWENVMCQADLTAEIENLKKAIKSRNFTEKRNLRERLMIFYQHQRRVGVDAGDLVTRTMWNYVVSNMNKLTLEERRLGMYSIEYAKDGNFEIETGFINQLKLLYNIAVALGFGDAEDRSAVKCKIDNLICGLDKNVDIEDKLKIALESTYRLINPKVTVKTEMNWTDYRITSDTMDVYGTIYVKILDREVDFRLKQNREHAQLFHNPVNEYNLMGANECIMEFAKDNLPIVLLLKKVGVSEIYKSWLSSLKLDTFHQFFIEDGFLNLSADKIEYYQRARALKFLKAVQGEEENMSKIERELKKYKCLKEFGEHIMVSDLSGKSQSLKLFIFRRYINSSLAMFLFGGNTLDQIIDPYDLGELSDDKQFRCIVNDEVKKTVTIYPTDYEQSIIEIPSKVSVGGEQYRINKIGKFAFFGEGIVKRVILSGDDFFELEIENNAFGFCNYLESFFVPKCMKHLQIGQEAFFKSNIENFAFSEGGCLKELFIEKSAFKGTVNLRRFTVPRAVEFIKVGEMAFSEEIGYGACFTWNFVGLQEFLFESDSQLVDFDLGTKAFECCQDLKLVQIPSKVEDLKISCGAFCMSNIENFQFAKDCVISKLYIDDGAFSCASRLERFVVPKCVTDLTIGKYAFSMIDEYEGNFKCFEFEEYSNLLKLRIDCGAFSCCSFLQELKFPKKLQALKIEKDAFEFCSTLKMVCVPKSVKFKYVDAMAFSNSPLEGLVN